ncbi:hypothetical protein [Sphingomonas parva]|uniref:hypothetical protein n=1 Tax=Sphingomonas parva TaxID=2555898 RepID=UPI001CDC64FC|nr:hypothetical protein [Sphingomonas parva]
MSGDNSTKRVVIVSGPQGFNAQDALFSEGVDVAEDDVLVTIERPGNIKVEVLEEEE